MGKAKPQKNNMLRDSITADAVALQERDEFREFGWLKIIAPAKVNLHLAVGGRRNDGYHDVDTVMHAINLHDVVFMRRILPDSPHFGSGMPDVRIIPIGDTPVPEIASRDNIASKAVVRLAQALGLSGEYPELEVRIEKSVPAEGGLGGGSADAAAALIGAARIWGIAEDDPAIEEVARSLGADVPFFLQGGCSRYAGTGNVFTGKLSPSKDAIALVKPAGGVSTPEAYRAFDEHPRYATSKEQRLVDVTKRAEDVCLFNNLAPASEALMPELTEVRLWLEQQDGVKGVLLCGSGATTFALCESFSAACAVVASARKRGWWARATSFGSARVMPVSLQEASAGAVANQPRQPNSANQENQPTLNACMAESKEQA